MMKKFSPQDILAEFCRNLPNLHPRRDLRKLELVYRIGIDLLREAEEYGRSDGYLAALFVFDRLYDVLTLLSRDIIPRPKTKNLWQHEEGVQEA